MSQLWVRSRQKDCRVNLRLLRQITQTTLHDLLGRDQYELAVYLVGPRAITRLNRTFLGHEGPTDVITFSHQETGPHLYGEIFVCPGEALRQAPRFRTTWQCELVRYVVHGILHLTGYSDTTDSARRKMKHQENRILRRLVSLFAMGELGKAKTP